MTSRRIAIVTGAGSGIGRSVALALCHEGYTVVLAGRRRGSLEETAGLTDSTHTLVVPTDVTREESVRELFRRALSECGRVDLLFNNAGVSAPAIPPDEISLKQWQHVVDVNLTGTFLCSREAFRLMKAQDPQGGRIINNGSISARAPRPLSAAYTATKHAITGLTKSILLDGRAYKIACGQIDIGNAATDMTRRMADGARQADGEIRTEPTFDVTHVAQAVVYMAGLPLDANVPFMTLMATNMPFIGRG